MRRALLALVILLAVTSLGAKGCSDDERCRAARGFAEATCRLRPGTAQCAAAEAEAEAACRPSSTPPPKEDAPKEDEPPEEPDPHTPVCEPPGRVGECWHRPAGQWRYNCAGGAPTVSEPAACPTAPACEIPDAPRTRPVEPRWPSPDRPPLDPRAADLVNRAWKALRPDCEVRGRCVLGKDTPVHEHLAALVREIRNLGGCAAVQAGADEICVLLEPGKCQGIHAVVPAGQWTVGWAVPGAHRDTWVIGSTPDPPPATCGQPRPVKPIAKAKAKVHNVGPAKVTLDVAFLFGPDAGYCAAAGWTDGRLYCQVRPEGAPDFAACEREFVGRPTWTTSLAGDVLGPGFLYSVPKKDFVLGKEESFKACVADWCSTVRVTRNAGDAFSERRDW